MFTASGSDCSRFVYYKHKTKPRILGLDAGSRMVHLTTDFNTFEVQPSKVPPGYRRTRFDKGWMSEFYCDESKTLLSPYKVKLDSGTKMYFTHDNGGRAFMVLVKGHRVKAFKRSRSHYTLEADFSQDDSDNAWMFDELVGDFQCEKVFVGKAQRNSMTEYSGGFGKEFDGNSFLLCISQHHYIHIGESIFSFQTDDELLQYYSPLGNNDVPYSYAISKNNVYFMDLGPKVFVPISKFPHFTSKVRLDAPSYFYELGLEKVATKLKKFKILVPRA